MTYLGVTHLTVGKTYVKSRSADICIRVLLHKHIKIGLICGSNGVSVGIGVVTEAVKEETQKADVKLINDYEERVMTADNSPSVKNIAKQIFAGIRDLFTKTAEKILGSVKRTLADPEVKAKNIGEIKDRARVSIADKLAQYKEEAKRHNEATMPKQNTRKGWERS